MTRTNLLAPALALMAGGMLAVMVFLNARLAVDGTALFSSWGAHATGTLAALVLLGLRALFFGTGRAAQSGEPAPWWAYLGGLSGAATVMATSVAANSPLALAGAIAFGLVGQAVFGLVADAFGLFGMMVRRPGARDLMAVSLILGGSLLILRAGA